MPEIIDLGTLFGSGDPLRDDRKLDLSGRPAPKDVRVRLNSGIEVRCEVRYDGIDDADNTRRFLVIAELDWENYWPTTLLVGEVCNDVTLALVTNVESDEHRRRATRLRVVAEKVIGV